MKIKNVIKKTGWVFAMLWMLLGVVPAQANLYKITGVEVTAERESALQAKEAALSEAQVVAFQQLMMRLSPENVSKLPVPNEQEVLSYVLGVSIEKEKTTNTKYIGTIGVEFNPSAVQEFLQKAEATYLKTQAPSLLVVPHYVTQTQSAILNEQNPLYMALKDKAFAPFYQAIVPMGTAEEQAIAEKAINEYKNPELLMDWLKKYNKEKLALLTLMQEEGDLWQMNIVFYPSDKMQNQTVLKKFRFSAGHPVAAADQMAKAVFKEMEHRWRQDENSSLNKDRTLYLRVPVASLAEWKKLEKQMKNWSFFEKISLKGIYLPQVLLEVVYKDNLGEVEQKLLAYGWRLNKDFMGNGATLTKVTYYE